MRFAMTRFILTVAIALCGLDARADLLNFPTSNPGLDYERQGSIPILTYNTFQRVFPATTHNPECRARQLGRALRNSPYDVVILQETFDASAVDALYEELGSAFPRSTTSATDPVRTTSTRTGD